MDWAVMTLIVLTFASFCTAHVATSWTIGARGPWWRGALAFVVPPLAPYWAIRDHLQRLAALWVGSLVAYVATRIVAAVIAGR